jgi:hypothetical protein
MHTWVPLFSRELALLAVLSALGSGLAALMPRELDPGIRWALAPAFGLASALCVTMTVLWLMPANSSWWLLIALPIASLAFAAWYGKRGPPESDPPMWRLDWRSAVQLALVAVVILAAFNRPLAEARTVGPMGYSIGDASGYVETADGARTESLRVAAHANRPPYTDLALGYYRAYASGYQEIGFDAVAADMDAMLGLGATQTYSPFVIALVAIAGMGMFAAVRMVTGTRSWAAVLAGVLAGGAFWLELFVEGSEGAIDGLALLTPLLVAGYLALRHRRVVDYVLFAVLAAGLQTAYPLFIPPVVIGGGAVLAVLGVLRWRGRSLRWRGVGRAAVLLTGILVLAAAFTPVAFARNVRYWHAILTGAQSFAGLPVYDLPAGLLPSWLLQTRNFYVLPQSFEARPIVASLLIPAAMIGVIYVALRRRTLTLGVAAIAAAATLLAYYVLHHDHCTYCEQRNLLVVSPLLTVIFAIGLAVLADAKSLGRRVAAIAIGVVALLSAAQQTRVEDRLLTQAAYYLEPSTRAVLGHIPHVRACALAIEGFEQTMKPWMELPLVYDAARETTGSPPSIVNQVTTSGSLDYILGPQPPGPQFDPHYRFVLTRLGAVQTPRRTVYRDGPVALQARVDPIDALVTGGVVVAFARSDPRGEAWIQGPLSLLVSGARNGQRVWVDINTSVTSSATVRSVPRSELRHRGATLNVCVPAPRTGASRLVTIDFAVALVPQPPPIGEQFGVAPPPRGLRLDSLRALSKRCW